MKSETKTTVTYTAEDNDKLSVVVENMIKNFSVDGFNTSETVTTSVVMCIDGKKIALPINKELYGQMEDIFSNLRYNAHVQTETEALEAVKASKKRNEEWNEKRRIEREAAAAKKALEEANVSA